jgi:hypothetical protein
MFDLDRMIVSVEVVCPNTSKALRQRRCHDFATARREKDSLLHSAAVAVELNDGAQPRVSSAR